MRSLVSAVASALVLTAAQPVLAQSADVEDLERKLDAALSLIEQLSQDLAAMKAEQESAPQPASRSASVDEEIVEIDARISDLEDVVDDMSEQVGSRAVVSAFDADKLNIGGFVDLAATHINGEDSSATSFNRQVFELLVSADLAKDWEIFVAQAFVRNAAPNFSDRLNPGFNDINSPVVTDTVLAWVNHKVSDWLNIRAGRFITPHGIINIEHFPATLLDPSQPQFLRPFPGQTMFPNFSNGFQIHGAGSGGGNNTLSYSIYAANFAGNSDKFNYGGRLAYNIYDLGVTVGANFAYGKRTDNNAADYLLYGADLLIDKGPIVWKSEIFATDEGVGDDRFAYYTQPAIRVNPKTTVFYRYDFLEAGDNPATLAPIGESTEHAFGVNFKPNKNVRLRGIVTLKDLEATAIAPQANAQQFQLSATLNF